MEYTWYQSSCRNDVNGEQRAVWKLLTYTKRYYSDEKRCYSFCAPGFSFRKDAESTPIWPPEQKVLAKELKIYPS